MQESASESSPASASASAPFSLVHHESSKGFGKEEEEDDDDGEDGEEEEEEEEDGLPEYIRVMRVGLRNKGGLHDESNERWHKERGGCIIKTRVLRNC